VLSGIVHAQPADLQKLLAQIKSADTDQLIAEAPKLDGAFDFVFLDSWKRDYKRFFDLLLPRLEPRGLFLAHNMVNKQAEMRDFLDAIKNDPRLFTTIVTPSGEGMSVSVKIK
jgi:predicted O-methyltransferase YrrM